MQTSMLSVRPRSPAHGTVGIACPRRLTAAAVALTLTVAAATALPSAAVADETAEALMHATSLSRAFRNAAEKAMPSVVVVRSETKAKRPAGRGQRQGQGQGQGEGQQRLVVCRIEVERLVEAAFGAIEIARSLMEHTHQEEEPR